MILDHTRPLFVRLLLVALLVLLPPVGLLTYGALGEFSRGLVPELDKKAEAVGRDLAGSLERALGLGIPLAGLYGMDEFLGPVLTANPEISYLAVTDDQGNILFGSGARSESLARHYAAQAQGSPIKLVQKTAIGDFIDLAQPLMLKGRALGQLHVGMGQDYVQSRLMEIAIDIMVVTLVALLLAVEILLFVVTFNVTGPMRLVRSVIDRVRRGDFSVVCGIQSDDEVGRFVDAFNGAIRRTDEMYRRLEAYVDEVKAAHFDKTVVERVSDIQQRVGFLFRFTRAGGPDVVTEQQASDIRLPLFLFVFAEEISRSFMPNYVRELYSPIAGLTVEMVTALPIAVFMFCIAAISPKAAMISAKRGSRAVFLMGIWPATIGFFGTAFAVGVWDFTLWRAVTAIGYALVTMACQGYIAQVSQEKKRAQGLGVYVGAVLTASVCGTGFGGVLAERVGFAATFLVATVLTVVAGILIYRLMGAGNSGQRSQAPAPGFGQFLGLLRNWRFSALIAFAAIPSKIALTGFFFFLVPLTLLQGAGTDLGDVARIMMMYPIAVVLISPLAGRLADHLGWKAGLVAVGGLIGGIGLVLPALFDGFNMVGVAIVLLGVSHGMSAAPQLAMIPDVCWTECRAMGQTNVLAFLRLAERVGSVIGPLLAAAFIPVYGYGGAVVALGVVVLGMSVVFAALSFAYGSGPHIETDSEAAP
jgi:predicted MFS family arabinose efflux permease/HAMP domain-containing protein